MIKLFIIIFILISCVNGEEDNLVFETSPLIDNPILSLPELGAANTVIVDVVIDIINNNGNEAEPFINLTNITEIYNNKTKQMFGDKDVTIWNSIRTY